MRSTNGWKWAAGSAAVMLMALPSRAAACAVCFGASDAQTRQGVIVGVVALLSVTFFVLAGVAAFFIHLRKRAKSQSAGRFAHQISEAEMTIKGEVH